jgi:tetratricopeptide (TPR) repeat protein
MTKRPEYFYWTGCCRAGVAFMFFGLIATVSPASGKWAGIQEPETGHVQEEPATGGENATGELFRKVSEMIAAGDVRDAVAEVDRFQQANPGNAHSQDIHQCRQLLYQAFVRISSFRDAWDELKKLLDYELADLSDPISLESAPGTIAAMMPLAGQTARNPETFALIEAAEAKYQALADANPTGIARQLLSQLRLIKGSSLIQINEYEKAIVVFREEVARLRELRDGNSGDDSIKRLYFQAVAQLGINSKDLAERDPALAEYQEFVTENIKQDSENPEWLRMYVAVISARIDARLVRPERIGEPVKVVEQDVIDKLFADGKAVVSAFTANDPQVRQLTAALTGALTELEIVVKANAKIPELIGKPAGNPAIKAWVNGADPGDDGRKGKVVLLSFWSGGVQATGAVIEYNNKLLEKFAGSDLVVLGVTQYYNLRWHEESGSLLQARSPVPAEEEEEALEKFLAKRSATWPVMLVEAGLSLLDIFGASSLPHFVLIDKQGNIQMIRVAFNDNVKADLEAKITELLK